MGIPGVVFWAAGLGLAICAVAVVWGGASPSLQRRWVSRQDAEDAAAAYLARVGQGMSTEKAWGLLPRRFRDASADAALLRYLLARAAGTGHADAMAQVSAPHRSTVEAQVRRARPEAGPPPGMRLDPPGP